MTLDELKRLEEAATEGPWQLVELTCQNRKSSDFGKKYLAVKQGEYFLDEDIPDCDAAFIAAMRNAAPALIRCANVLDSLLSDPRVDFGSPAILSEVESSLSALTSALGGERE